jgi:flagellar FliL protein
MMRVWSLRALVGLACLLPLPATVLGSDNGDSTRAARDMRYVDMTPPFVVSIGHSGRIGYLKAGVSLRVEEKAATAVELHMPALRHELVLLLSRQQAAALERVEGRERLRNEALESVRRALSENANAEGIEDLLFTSFIVQR